MLAVKASGESRSPVRVCSVELACQLEVTMWVATEILEHHVDYHANARERVTLRLIALRVVPLLPTRRRSAARKAIVNLVYDQGGGRQVTMLASLLNTCNDNGDQIYMPEGLPAAIVNWQRLGLVTVSYSVSIASDDAYDWVKTHPNYAVPDTVPDRISGVTLAREKDALYVEKGVLDTTSFGYQFILAVQADRSVHPTF